MGLFQNSVIQKYIKQIDATLLESKYQECIAHFGKAEIQDNIRSSKEEQYQEGFLRDLFVNILGYTLNPSTGYNLITENKNLKDSKKADGAIIIDRSVKAVIELKGTDTTDLAKVETQAFGYKNNQIGCLYVITSNFEKIRFYIEDATDFEEFSLFNLSREQFALLYLCLSYQSIARGLPLAIKHESTSEEKQITDKFYKAYTSFKRELYHDLVSRNPQFDPLTLFKKSQKLLDRFLFLFFAEDRALLPPNSVRLILSDWRELQERDVQIPLYERYKKYFGYLNTGYRGKRYDVFAYNGGLFKPDHILDTVTIDDEMLFSNTFHLSDYDFVSEVDVNILGHIFENSLNEIDEIKAELEGIAVDRSKTKRKKDGVFYTPKYITKYIVHSTVGALCTAKKNELGIIDQDFAADKKRQTRTKQALLDKLALYRTWLLQITICDPACGSGAFLNQALDFLIAEHRYIDELQAKVYGASLILSDVEKNILENNIYGVDLNEESVEIAKLSLWLRTAQPGRKLSDLSSNIKCGNSLISDPAIAGDKAFNWQDEFPQVFVNGGFDVIIGNPPYGIFIDLKSQEHFDKYFPLTSYKTNLYILFIERMLQIFQKGTIHFIIPKSLLFNSYYESIRKALILKTEIVEIYTITEKVFEDAEVGSSLLLKFNIKADPNTKNIVRLAVAEKIENFTTNFGIIENNVEQEYFLGVPNCEISVISSKSQSIIEKLHSYKQIRDFYYLKNGLNPGNIKHILISDLKESENHKPVIWGRDINRYRISWSGQYINYDASIAERISLDDIKSKEGMNKQTRIDFALRTSDLFENRKIVIRKTGDSLIGCIDENNYYFDTLVHGIYLMKKEYTLEALIAILNSKAATVLYRLLHDIKGKVFAKISLDNLGSFPLPSNMQDYSNELHEKATLISVNTLLFQKERKQFIELLTTKYNSFKSNSKLNNWCDLDTTEFLNQFSISNIKLSLAEESEWIQFFKEQKEKAQKIATLITATDIEIDNLVYQLYGLSPEETKIIENSVK